MMRGLVLLLLLALPARAQDTPAPLLLRLQVEHQGPAWIGQRVTVTLTAMTPSRFVGAIAWPDLAASSGRIIVLPEAATLPGTERLGGRTYAALSRSYAVFPATPGEIVLGPVTMQVRVAGPDAQPVAATASTEATTLAVRMPPDITDPRQLVVAPRFAMQAQDDGTAAPIHVGDAVTRTITMQADDTAAMMLPPVAWRAPAGMRVYAEPPVLQDRSDRGTLHAQRRERAAFVPQRPGQFELPGVTVAWLDPRRGAVRQVVVEPLRLEVLPAAAAAPASRDIAWALPATGVAVLLIGGVGGWWVLRRRAAAPDPLGALRAACRSGDPRAALRALYQWSDAVLPPGGERTIRRLAILAETPDLLAQAQRLEAVVFAAGHCWDGAALVRAAHGAQRRLHAPGPHGRQAALPPLNPVVAAARPPRLSQPRWVR